ncbi:MAG: chorismate pyruvate-lyase family protein [Actinobacteria bacterium]|nr:chorismate pyruvate-lyase family protein [Actinomycetota bacterium]
MQARFRLEPGREALVDPAPRLLQRVLLQTDGNVACILETYAGESIEAVKLEQFSAPFGEEILALELGADDERLSRRVILRGRRTGRNFLHAESLIAVARLHPVVRSGLLSTSEPIGRLLTGVRAETFREILSSGRMPAWALGAHFGVRETDEVFVRTYRIMSDGRPLMLITEKFPTTWFLS